MKVPGMDSTATVLRSRPYIPNEKARDREIQGSPRYPRDI